MVFHKILVPLDASELAERALSIALSLAGAFGSEVILLSVRAHGVDYDDQDEKMPSDLISFEGEAEGLMAMARRKLPGTGAIEDNIRVEVRAGAPEDAIVQAANDLMVDLIVMGTHGRVGLIDKLVGSTTERVQAKTPASVLAVKPLGFPFLRE